MFIEHITISIYDTTLPEVIGQKILDFAEKGSIHWIYEGGDTKFLPIIASRLEFDMEVSIEESLDDLVYDYLFTGNETRYAVEIADQDGNVMWRGHLLPEEYTEPYTTGTYFIHFTATDGLGRLRGKKLPNSFYKARQSNIKAISDCLRETGLELDILVDTAIDNALGGDQWENIYVNATTWENGNDPADCYTVLTDIVTAMGCTLFQQNNKWYIVGWNKRGGSITGFRRYTYDGVIDTVSQLVSNKNLNWYATPSVGIKPPFRQVTVDVGRTDNEMLFPKEIASQKIKWNADVPASGRIGVPPAYWKSNTLDLELLIYMEPDTEWLGAPLDLDSNPSFYNQMGDLSYPANMAYYMSLKDPIYVKKGLALDIDMALRVAYIIDWFDTDQINNNAVMYEITIDGVTVMSNKRGWQRRSEFKLTFEHSRPGFVIDLVISKAKLEVKEFIVPVSGLLDVKIYYGVKLFNHSPIWVSLLQLDVRYQQEKYSFIKRRAIDYTNTATLSISNTDSVMDQENHSFVYQPPIDISILKEVIFEARGYDTYGFYVLLLRAVDYNEIQVNPKGLFLLRENSDFYEHVAEFRIFPFIQDYFITIILPDGHLITNQDRLFVHPTINGTPQTVSVIEAREEWKKTNGNKIDRLGNVLAEIHHDVYPESVLVMEGDAKGLLQPLDLMQFELKHKMRNYVPVRMDIIPNENTTTINMIEFKNTEITDYEQS